MHKIMYCRGEGSREEAAEQRPKLMEGYIVAVKVDRGHPLLKLELQQAANETMQLYYGEDQYDKVRLMGQHLMLIQYYSPSRRRNPDTTRSTPRVGPSTSGSHMSLASQLSGNKRLRLI